MYRFLVFATLLSLVHGRAANWPQFRGPDGSGIARDSNIPVHFGPDSNVVWKVAISGGHSSPVLWQDRIFLTGFDEGELQTLCLDRHTGQTLWKRSLKPDHIERSARHSHPAASTPCTDGERLFVYFGSFGAAAYDFAGRELWRKPLPVPVTQHGASSSPVLAGNLLILQRDADVDSHLLALNTRDGSIAWRTDRPDARRGFSTPLVLRRAQLESVRRDAALLHVKETAAAPEHTIVVPGTLRVAAYDASNGHELWTARGLPNEMCSSPVFGDDLVFVAGWTPGSGASSLPTYDSLLERGDRNTDGKLTREEAPSGPARQHFLYIDADKDGFITGVEWDVLAEIFTKSQNAALAIRPDGHGDVTATHVVWEQKRGLPYVPTPLYYQHRVYLLKNGGLLSCLNATNGAALFQEERIGALGDYYASPVAANGKICVVSQSGIVTVLKAGDELTVLGRNELRETVLATPAIAWETLYLRTESKLYAFSESEPAAPAGE